MIIINLNYSALLPSALRRCYRSEDAQSCHLHSLHVYLPLEVGKELEVARWARFGRFCVHKLAPYTIGAIEGSMVGFAQASFVLAWQIYSLLELFVPVSEGTCVPKATTVRQLPISAHLRVIEPNELTSVLYLTLKEGLVSVVGTKAGAASLSPPVGSLSRHASSQGGIRD